MLTTVVHPNPATQEVGTMTDQNQTPDITVDEDTGGHARARRDDDVEGHGRKKSDDDTDDVEGHGRGNP
jgi:hypothetical protein